MSASTNAQDVYTRFSGAGAPATSPAAGGTAHRDGPSSAIARVVGGAGRAVCSYGMNSVVDDRTSVMREGCADGKTLGLSFAPVADLDVFAGGGSARPSLAG